MMLLYITVKCGYFFVRSPMQLFYLSGFLSQDFARALNRSSPDHVVTFARLTLLIVDCGRRKRHFSVLP